MLTVHSGPHPVIVSGLGTNFPRHLQIGFPNLLAIHMVPGPQGDGLHGSGFSIHLRRKFIRFSILINSFEILLIFGVELPTSYL